MWRTRRFVFPLMKIFFQPSVVNSFSTVACIWQWTLADKHIDHSKSKKNATFWYNDVYVYIYVASQWGQDLIDGPHFEIFFLLPPPSSENSLLKKDIVCGSCESSIMVVLKRRYESMRLMAMMRLMVINRWVIIYWCIFRWD